MSAITKNTAMVLLPVILIMLTLSGCLGAGVDDVVVWTPEEEERWMHEQTDLFADVKIPKFEVRTIDGKTVTEQDCFGDFKLTMVNIWGTFCGPCIDEMPDIVKLYSSLPDDVNIITICIDADENEKNFTFANEVMQKAKAQFYTIIPNEQIKTALTDLVTSFPMTVFVDADGRTVGTPYFGTQDEEGYKEAIYERLDVLENNNNEGEK